MKNKTSLGEKFNSLNIYMRATIITALIFVSPVLLILLCFGLVLFFGEYSIIVILIGMFVVSAWLIVYEELKLREMRKHYEE